MINQSQTAITFDQVSKRYFKQGTRTFKEMLHALFIRREKPGEFLWALRNITLSIAPGTTYGVIGKNGSGKSTLLKLIASVSTPTTGKTLVQGRIAPIIELGAGFHPDLTGRENITLNAAMLGMTKAEIQAATPAIIDFAELAGFLDTPVKYYSSGMYLRLAFAVAIHVHADILLIDEILAVGDEVFQQKCLAKLNSLKKEGKTIVYVSHNIHSVLDFCDRGLYLDHGKVKEEGNIIKVVKHYSQDMEKEL
ncbi:MAG: ABC transporter ATP-binding protein [bacterium]